MAIRQSIRGLEADPVQLAAYRSAFSAFSQRRDDTGYSWFASIHGLPLPMWCEHSRFQLPVDTSLLFLPWHRAYLYYYELALQGRLGPRLSIVESASFDDLGVPWWDWTTTESHHDGMPTSYNQRIVGGSPNPLASAEIPVAVSPLSIGVWSDTLLGLARSDPNISGAISSTDPPRTVRDPEDSDELPNWSGSLADDDIESILSATTFEDFSMRLEVGPHNSVHGWVGGSMSIVPTAAFDPIFWSHHCMIDRIWYLWQNSQNGKQPPNDMLDTVLSPFPMTVAQTLDISRLGYEYAVQVIQ